MDVFIGGTVCFPNGWIVGTFVLFFVPSGLFCVCVPNAWIFGTFFFFFPPCNFFFFFFFFLCRMDGLFDHFFFSWQMNGFLFYFTVPNGWIFELFFLRARWIVC